MDRVAKGIVEINSQVKDASTAVFDQSEAAQHVSANSEELAALSDGLISQVNKFKF